MWQEKKIQNQFSIHDHPSSIDYLGSLKNVTFYFEDQTRSDQTQDKLIYILDLSHTLPLFSWTLNSMELKSTGDGGMIGVMGILRLHT